MSTTSSEPPGPTAGSPDPRPHDPLHGLSTHDLETELLGLAGHLAAAQCRFLQLLAEYDRRDGWAGPGLRSCAHWLSWRIGMSLRTATEHVRVAHALAELPKVTEAFAAGRISYSKVRAITRLHPTPAETAAPEQPAPPTAPHDGTPDDRTQADRSEPEGARDSPLPPAPPPPDGLAADAEQTLLALALGGTASHVEAVVRATRRRQIDPRQPAALRSLSWSWAEDGSLVLRGRFAPAEGAALVAAIEALVPARKPVTHLDPPPPDGWEQSAVEQEPGAVVDRMGARRADALVNLVLRPDGGTDAARTDGDQGVQVILHVEDDAVSAEIVDGPEISAATAERLACNATVQALLEDKSSNRLYLGRRRRLASPAQIAALTVRDGRCCQFPGCTNARYLHAHHVRHWLFGGRTDLDNLILICTFHHGLIHDRRYRIRRDRNGWLFLRPDGSPVPPAMPPLGGRVESLIEINTRAELAITRNSLTPSWGGERLQLEPILDSLLPRPTGLAA
jgi:Domain of unknown function (DUF222)/HNH endonuclease